MELEQVWRDLSARIQRYADGTDSRCYEWLGCHPAGDGGYTFRVWAPDAQAVSLVGDFCQWDAAAQPMESVGGGVWECTLQTVQAYSAYGYHIMFGDGQAVVQGDPYATLACVDGCVAGAPAYAWQTTQRIPQEPLNVYEVHLAGWRRYADGQVFSYDDLAAELIPYVRDMGFTHLRLLGVADGLIPDARHGYTDGFMAFTDACHQAGLGVLADWQPPAEDTPAAMSAALSRARYWWEILRVDGLWIAPADVGTEAVQRLRETCADIPLLQTSAGDVAPPSGRSLLAGMPGDEEQQFAAVRSLLSYRLLSPITHRMTMGDELGHQRPWDADGSLDWLLLDYESHRMLRHYVCTLNTLYLDTPALWNGAVWMPENGVLTARISADLLAVCNTTPFRLEQIPVGVADNSTWQEWFNSDWAEFGGAGRRVSQLTPTTDSEGGYPYRITLSVPPLTTLLLRRTDK